MKRIIAIISCTLLLAGLCSCAGGDEPAAAFKSDDSTFIVSVVNDTADEIYGLHFEYGLDGTAMGGAMAGRADGSAIPKGEALKKDFIPLDFKTPDDLSDFQLELYVLDADGNEYPCAASLEWDAAYGNEYSVSLTGSYMSGFSAELQNDTQRA